MAAQASLVIRGDDSASIGRERIRILEAVAREGSISAAARSVGLTYKATWDALDAMANLFGMPLLETRAGGRAGGGTQLTEAGQRVVASFHRLEAELARVMRDMEPELAGTGLAPASILTGFLLRTSCRNLLRGRITAVTTESLRTRVSVDVGGCVLDARVTRDSAVSLGLCPGREVVLLVKAPFVSLRQPGSEGPSDNAVPGVVAQIAHEGDGAEVTVTVGEGRSMTASVAASDVRTLGLAPGRPVLCTFDPLHAIIAID